MCKETTVEKNRNLKLQVDSLNDDWLREWKIWRNKKIEKESGIGKSNRRFVKIFTGKHYVSKKIYSKIEVCHSENLT